MGVNSNTYQFNAQDIGSSIQVEIIPEDEDSQGTAILIFGQVGASLLIHLFYLFFYYQRSGWTLNWGTRWTAS